MASDPSLLIQKTIRDALIGDSKISNAVTDVFDFVPDKTVFPYITVGDDTAVDWGAKDFDGMDYTINIHTWSRARGRKECKDIMFEVYRVLHLNDLNISGFKTVLCRFDFAESSLDPDGQTYHGVQRFKVIVGGI